MKKIASLLLVAVFAGVITLGAYKLFFEKTNYRLVTEESRPVVTTNYAGITERSPGIEGVNFTDAAEKTVNAVVHVKNVTEGRSSSSLLEFFYGSEKRERSRPQIGTGSGVIISPDGFIVTNNHVIAKADELQVTLNNNKTYDAKLVGTDSDSDIALLKIDADVALPYLAFGDSDNAKIGEWVLAVGNPFNLTSTVTAGIVSAKARSLDFRRNQSFIQTDAAVNPGNSGGALVNTNGDLIGINTAITSQTGSYVGYSFAVPSNIAKKVVEDILEYGNVQSVILGISAANTQSQQAIESGLNEIDGVYISGIEEESGAADAGLREGDIIKQIDQVKVRKFADLTGYISSKRAGDKVNVFLERNNQNLEVLVTLKTRKSIILPIMGLRVKNLTKEDQELYNTKNGVKVIAVPETYKGYNLENKVLISVDDKKITDVRAAKELFNNISVYGRTTITILNEEGEKERLIFQ